jgi:hypothetical protein
MAEGGISAGHTMARGVTVARLTLDYSPPNAVPTSAFARQRRARAAELVGAPAPLVSASEQVLGGLVSHAAECMTASTDLDEPEPRLAPTDCRGQPPVPVLRV